MVIPKRSPIRRIDLPAASTAAGALWTLRVQRNMTELTRHTVQASRELSIREDPGAETFGHRHHDQVTNLAPVAKPDLRQNTSVGGVLKLDPHFRRPLDRSFEVEFGPFQVRCKDYALGLFVKSSGQTDANPFKDPVGVCFHQMTKFRDEIFCCRLRMRRCLHYLLREETPVHIRNGNRCSIRPEVGHKDRPAFIQP